MTTLAAIWRHPLKGHGAEAIQTVTLATGQTLPWDRTWAVAHEKARVDGGWAPCANFLRGAKAPALMAIQARLDEARAALTLTHPDRPDLTFRPDEEAAAFLDWVSPLIPAGRLRPEGIVRVPGRGMTDTPYPSISLNSLASLRDLSAQTGQEMSPLRFRGNLWLEDLPAWAEMGWQGRRVRIGGTTLQVRTPIGRCMATAANPDTGHRDADTLGVLRHHRGGQDFGIYAEVIGCGRISVGDSVEVLP
ncbi:hypothetical protein C8N32_13311 [Rhodovulum imhoffii]|uniref:MOSC domain-containing protein n=1 Tax=Rhodovulum imhoffii TaxID=365340 RepID=A0A2T5BNK2_9RHOB|nr:MOSC N-terminal beta barrel domain-containing protein [Rhodovulum imhoffii]MBK5932543.1 molybdenum cofactor biosysynthesis protein [Rhodovulum imhoffii]PTN00534.1 hypothetical protein C8N32_13311 [Rhodovulum imhoffii]